MTNWKIEYYNDVVEEELSRWPKKLYARYLRTIDLLEEQGPNLGMALTRAMGEGLFEIRVKTIEGAGRAFFCVVVDRKIIILHSIIKKTDKTPRKELRLAKKRLKEVKRYG